MAGDIITPGKVPLLLIICDYPNFDFGLCFRLQFLRDHRTVGCWDAHHDRLAIFRFWEGFTKLLILCVAITETSAVQGGSLSGSLRGFVLTRN